MPDSETLHTRGRRAIGGAVLAAGTLAAALAILAVTGCGRNSALSLLAPTGEKPQPAIGVISGRLDFGTPGTFPRTLILVARVRQPGFSSTFNTIQVVGTPTGFNVAQSPHLTQLAPGGWIDTLSVPEGAFEWKFVTDGAFDSPPDFGKLGGQEDGLEGEADLGAPGPDGNLKATVPAGQGGLFLASLDETQQPAPYAFKKIGPESPATFSSTADGSFAITGLVPGTYNVLIRPASAAPVTRTVTITNAPADLGTVNLGGGSNSVFGQLDFDPTTWPDMQTGPWPPVVVRLFQGTFLVATDTTARNDRGFAFANVAAGTYRIKADAIMFARDSIDVTVTGGATDAGTLTLLADFGEIASAMHVAGDFNNFTIADSTMMNLALPLVWEYTPTHPIAAGTYNMKFVTDASFDNPTDYGGNESVTIPLPVSQSPTSLVSGFGTAIRVSIAASATFKFTLDERRQSFSIETVPAPGLAPHARAGTASPAVMRFLATDPRRAPAVRRAAERTSP